MFKDFLLWPSHSCKERKNKAWNLLLSLCVSCLQAGVFWKWKNVSQARPKTPSARKGDGKFQRVYFKHISDCIGTEVYDGSLNILLMVFLIAEKDIELRLARQHQLNLIRFKQLQILFAISTCTPQGCPIYFCNSRNTWKYGMEIWVWKTWFSIISISFWVSYSDSFDVAFNFCLAVLFMQVFISDDRFGHY